MRRMRSVIGGLLVFVAAVGMVSSVNASPIYNLSTDWSTLTSEPVPWSYGKYGSALSPATFSVFTTYRTVFGLEEWYNGPVDPNLIKNPTNATIAPCCGIDFHAGSVTFGPYLGPAVARWTAPSSGMFQVDATFATVQTENGAPNAYIYDGTTLNNLGLVPAYGVGILAYHQTLTLAEGQWVDFVVWGGNQNNKTTEVSATVTAVPEPATLTLLGLGLAGAARAARRRKR